jgi:hypothetical protein
MQSGIVSLSFPASFVSLLRSLHLFFIRVFRAWFVLTPGHQYHHAL